MSLWHQGRPWRQAGWRGALAAVRSTAIPVGGDAACDGVLVLPDAGHGPGVLLIQEVFGINAYVRSAAGRLAALGYVVVVPDVFWRIEPHVAVDDRDEPGLRARLGYMRRLDVEQAVADRDAALAHLRDLPEEQGQVGVVGFCIGGTLGVAARRRLVARRPRVVPRHGGARRRAPGGLCRLPDPAPLRERRRLHRAGEGRRAGGDAGRRSNIEIHVRAGAGHAFDNPSPLFHAPEAVAAAAAVLRLTADFLGRTLGAAATR